MTVSPSSNRAPSGVPGGVLMQAVDQLAGLDLDRLSDDQVSGLLGQVHRQSRRLAAQATRLAGVLTDRRVAAARAANPDDRRAAEKAVRDVRRELVDDHRLSPSAAKQTLKRHDGLATLPAAREAYQAGDISDDHVRVLQATLDHLVGDQQAALEAELIAAARTQDPVAFGRYARGRLNQLEPDAAQDDLERLHRRRRASAAVRPDGMSVFSAHLAGMDGAFLHATLDAFRTPDASDEHRTAEQRTADAFNDLVRAAAGTIDDPNARHGLPVVLIQLPAEPLLGQTQTARLAAADGTETFTGPLPAAELERLLGNAHLAAVVSNARGVPVAVTRHTRYVPVGIQRLLIARDRGCVMAGCDTPAGWCQVAHLDTAYGDRGKLSPSNSLLLCIRHHRRFDTGHLAVTWTNGRPIAHPPGQPPDRASGPEIRSGAAPGTRPPPPRPGPTVVRETASRYDPRPVDHDPRRPPPRSPANSPPNRETTREPNRVLNGAWAIAPAHRTTARPSRPPAGSRQRRRPG